MKCLSINYLQAQMKRRAGFTLIELLVVMSILAVLLGALANKYSPAEQNKRMIKVDNDLKVIATAMLQYEQDSLTASLPSTVDELLEGLPASDSYDGQAHEYISLKSRGDEADKLVDPWGNDYVIDVNSRTVSCTPKDIFKQDLPTVKLEF